VAETETFTLTFDNDFDSTDDHEVERLVAKKLGVDLERVVARLDVDSYGDAFWTVSVEAERIVPRDLVL